MQQEMESLSSEDLIAQYHKINAELRDSLFKGAPWDEQQEKINVLTKISKELIKRKVDVDSRNEML